MSEENSQLLSPANSHIVAKSCNLQLNSSGNIKLCGYLKKKRNKVGGWRKMWFVLQDKLLLSYASKEEYDNKLVSFKDVLNLIPGTVVRPLSGYRFTIETTSNALYTFHCEDRHAYREWITTLLNSLSAKELRFQRQRVFNSYSMENLPNSQQIAITTMTHSFECIAHARRQHSTKSNENCVRLPIVNKTKKILERNGGTQQAKQQQQELQQEVKEDQQQCEIQLPATITMDCCLQLCCNTNNNNNNNCKQINNNNNNKRNSNNVQKQKAQLLRNSKVNVVINKNRLQQQQQQIDTYYKTCKACSNMQENSSVYPQSETEIFKWNTDVATSVTVAAETTSCLLGTSCSMELMQEKLQKCCLEEVTRGSKEQPIRAKLKSAGSLTSLAVANNCKKTNEPIYAVVNLKTKYAHRQQQKAKQEQESQLRRCNSYDSVLAAATEMENNEKYTHKKSASYNETDDIEAIYEDGELLLFANHHNNNNKLETHNLPCTDCELENIYEPIEVRRPPRKTLWRYITQLKVTPFLHLKNNISSNKKNMAHYESIKVGKNKVPTTTTTKHLNTLRHKFGTHRRSMQLRMRKLFKQTKRQQNGTTTSNYNNNYCEDCHVAKSNKNKKQKSEYRLKIKKSKSDKTNFVPQKRFFGSLKHLRKPQVHLFNTQRNCKQQN